MGCRPWARIISSCNPDEKVAVPVISSIEIGIGNSLTGYVGTNLHVEASIVADGKISGIRIVVHPDTGDNQKTELLSSHSVEWNVDTVFTGVYSGVKNTTFHEHIIIPVNALIGKYHFHIYVTDYEGNQALYETEISLIAPIADGNPPVITITGAPAQNQQFTNGQTINIAGNITDLIGLAGLYIGLVNENLELTNAMVTSTNTITVLHTHDFIDNKNHTFSASINVGAITDNDIVAKPINWQTGNYFILVKSPSIDGDVAFSARYPVIISLN